jgi:hypothetical protein
MCPSSTKRWYATKSLGGAYKVGLRAYIYRSDCLYICTVFLSVLKKETQDTTWTQKFELHQKDHKTMCVHTFALSPILFVEIFISKTSNYVIIDR